ncbi:MAG: heavy-metal-associated domain-containing protein, partial [Halobacteriales archaeon]
MAREPVAQPNRTPAAAGETAYLNVSGMHCATCETFIEQRAGDADGVQGVEASYPAGIVKLTYDPDRLDA